MITSVLDSILVLVPVLGLMSIIVLFRFVVVVVVAVVFALVLVVVVVVVVVVLLLVQQVARFGLWPCEPLKESSSRGRGPLSSQPRCDQGTEGQRSEQNFLWPWLYCYGFLHIA